MAVRLEIGEQREVRQVEPRQERRRVPNEGSHGLGIGCLSVRGPPRPPGEILGGKAVAGHQDREESPGPAARVAVGPSVAFPVLVGRPRRPVSVSLADRRPGALVPVPAARINDRHGAEQQEVALQPLLGRREGLQDALLGLVPVSSKVGDSPGHVEQRGEDEVIAAAPAVSLGVRLPVPDCCAFRIPPLSEPYPEEQRPPLASVQQLLEDLLDLERVVNYELLVASVHRQPHSPVINALLAQGGIQDGKGPYPDRGGAAPQCPVEPPGVADDFQEQPIFLVPGVGGPS